MTSRANRLGWSLALSAIVVAIGVAFMPARFYRGDPHAVRLGTMEIVERGAYGVPYAERERVPAFLLRLNMLFQNDDRERIYPRSRILNSLLIVPPMAAEKLIAGSLESHHLTRSLLALLNLYNVLVSVIIALYAFALGRRYTKRTWMAALVALSCLYGSCVWYYLRAQASEIFQIWFTLGFVTHMVIWSDRSSPERRLTPGLVAAMFYGLLLTQLKTYYGLLFPLAWLALIASAQRSQRFETAVTEAVRVGALAAVAALLVLVENWYFFGGIWSFGYGKEEFAELDLRTLSASIPGFLFRMDRSIFWHAPLLLLIPFSARRLFADYRFDLLLGAFLLPAFILVIGGFDYWQGDWCYGPRYLVFILPFFGMLSLPAIDRVLSAATRDRRAWALAASIALMVVVSGWSQTRVNALEFHANYEAHARYRSFESERIDRYFTRSHSSIVFADLLELRDGDGPYPPSVWARRASPEAGERIDQIERELRSHFILRPNYFWSAEAVDPGAR